MRYDQLLVLTTLYKPRTIIEIGTNKGDRGVAMCEEALKHRTRVRYIGYDVFDTKEEEFHARVFNGKGFFAKDVVARRFDELGGRNPGFSYELVQGTTQETLHGKHLKADFVFIDGDHRQEAIAADYAAVRRSRVVVFDDYYSKVPGCTEIDTTVLGCNRVVDPLPGHVILPIPDRFPHAGDIRMAMIVRPQLWPFV